MLKQQMDQIDTTTKESEKATGQIPSEMKDLLNTQKILTFVGKRVKRFYE